MNGLGKGGERGMYIKRVDLEGLVCGSQDGPSPATSGRLDWKWHCWWR